MNIVTTDTILFAIGPDIYYWHPLLDSPVKVVTRPDIVTAIVECDGVYGRPILDACCDGLIRTNLSDTIHRGYDYPIYDIFVNRRANNDQLWLLRKEDGNKYNVFQGT